MHNIFQAILNYCTEESIPLTEQQSLVLRIICEHKEALAAHQILDDLKLNNAKANRMTIHRALEYLTNMQIIHKISFNNTYVACTHLAEHKCQLLVCIKCGKKIEFSSSEVFDALKLSSEKQGFHIKTPIEIMGICEKCRE